MLPSDDAVADVGDRPRRRLAGRAAVGLCLLFAALSAADCVAASPAEIAVAGIVLDETGAPLRGAEVSLHPTPPMAERMALLLEGKTPAASEPATREVTGEDGRYRIDAPGPGDFLLVACAPGRMPMERRLEPLLPLPPGAPARPLELPPVSLGPELPGGLEVDVVDEAGRPAEGALVEVSVSDEPRSGEPWYPGRWSAALSVALTDAEGQARLPHAPAGMAGPARVRVLAGVRSGWRKLEDAKSAAPVRIRLGSFKARRVRLLRPDGSPAAGALVWAGLEPFGRAGADGTIELPGAGSRLRRIHAATDDGLGTFAALDSGAEATGAVQEITLRPPEELEGQVVGLETRQPIASALVWRSRDPGSAVRTGADGRFRLKVPAGVAEAVLQVAAPGDSEAQQAVSHGDGGFPADTEIGLEPTEWIAGSVADAEGRPVAGVEAWTAPQRSDGQLEMSRMRVAWTSPDGAFLLTGLEAGPAHQVHALKTGYAPAVASAPPKAHSILHLTLRTARTVAGRVLDEAGAPVAGARVALLDKSALADENLWVLLPDVTKTTGAEGRFAFHKVPPQLSILAVVAAGHAPLFRFDLKVPPEAAVTDLGDLTLAPEASVRGRVVDSGGKPVAGAQVRRETYSPQSTLLDAFLRKKRPSWPLSATTGADGSFELGRFAPGEETVLDVVAEGFASAETEATAGPDAKPVKVTLWAAASVAGEVTDEAGRPVARAAVAPAGSGLGGSEFRWVTTDGQGRFEVQGVAPGRVLLRAQARGYAMSEVVGVDVAPGGHVDGVHLALRPGHVLRGQVLTPDGRPIAGVQVSARPGSIVATTGPDGAFSIDDLPQGKTELDLDRKGLLPTTETVELDPDGPPLEIHLPVAEVTGVLLGPDRKPAAGREIALLPKDSRIVWGEGFATKTAADGSFRFRGVADGTWLVKVAGPDVPGQLWTSPEPVVVQSRPVHHQPRGPPAGRGLVPAGRVKKKHWTRPFESRKLMIGFNPIYVGRTTRRPGSGLG